MIKDRSDQLIEAIKKDAKASIYEFFFITFIMLWAGAVGYHFDTGFALVCLMTFDVWFYCYYMYISDISKFDSINRIIIDIHSDGNTIAFKTSETMQLHVFRKPGIAFEMSEKDINYMLTNDGWGKLFSKKRDYKGKSYKFLFNNREFYILTGFFNDEVNKMIDSSTN